MGGRGSNDHRKRFQVSTLHQSGLRRANSCEFHYTFIVVIWPYSFVAKSITFFLIGSLTFNDGKANNNATKQLFDWLNGEK